MNPKDSVVIPSFKAGDLVQLLGISGVAIGFAFRDILLVMELAGSIVNIRARWWIKPPRRADALDSRDMVLSAIKKKLVANGIDLPFPTQQILFHDQTEETDGDRSRQREGWPAGNKAVPKPRSIGGSLRKLAELRAQRDGNGSDHTTTANDNR